MKIKINSVENGAFYDDITWDFWVNGTLKNGEIINLFDPNAFNLKEYIGHFVDVQLKALFVQEDRSDDLCVFIGKIIRNNDIFIFTNENIEILLDADDVYENGLEINKIQSYYFGRLDIVTFNSFYS